VKPVGYVIRSNQKPTAYRTNGGLYDSRIEAAIVFKSRTEADIINGDRNSDVLPVWSSPVEYGEQALQIRFSNAQIFALKTAFGGLNTVDPDGATFKGLVEYIGHMHRDLITQLMRADIKWLSYLAKTEFSRRVPITKES
jgi:hypothetical protein